MPLCLGAIRSAVECKAAIVALASQMASPIAASTVADHVMVESGGNELAIHDDCTHEHRCSTPYFPKSMDEAVSIAKQLDAAGHRWSGGLTQIERENFAWLGVKNVQDIFDPRVAIAAQVQFLTSFSHYNTGNGWHGFANGYVQKIIAQRRIRPAVEAQTKQPSIANKALQEDDDSSEFWR